MTRPGRRPETSHESYAVYTVGPDGNVTPGHSLLTWRHSDRLSTARLSVGAAGRNGVVGTLNVEGASPQPCPNRGKRLDGHCDLCGEPGVFNAHPAHNGVVFGRLKAAIIRKRGDNHYLEFAEEASSPRFVIVVAEADPTLNGTLYTGGGLEWRCLDCGRTNGAANSAIPPARCPYCHGEVLAQYKPDLSTVLATGVVPNRKWQGTTVVTGLAVGETLRQVQKGSKGYVETFITWGAGWLSVITGQNDERSCSSTMPENDVNRMRRQLSSRIGRQDPRWFELAVKFDERRERVSQI
jgi:DNA-directed RNA polymerase subunit RPC12/RpoP